MPDALAASSPLPARPLRARPPIKGPWDIRTLLAILLFGGWLVFSVGWVAPDIYTDWLVRDTAVPIRGGDLSDGSCSSKLFLHTCDATLSAPAGMGRITREVHYVFASFTMGDFTATVVGDPRRPEWLTTDLGLDYFWDRVVSLLLDFVLVSALIWGAAKALRDAHRTRAAWRRAEMMPVPLRLVKTQKVTGGQAWTVQAEGGKTARWTVPRRAKPFVLGPASDRVLGLAIRGGGGIMPLDAGLRWVELSKEERSAALVSSSNR